MVRLRTSEVRSAKGLFQGLVQRGLNIEALNNLTLESIFFNLCEGKFKTGNRVLNSQYF